ncbi:MAG: electron transfer flavoprotein subunit alpha/FixB family protein [Anaerolineaceae bacterium]|nr:MAG: electron transfer flavoprotein subunit alpha/FixB family protein [Anaerolineaceae bacterium]
MNKDILVTIEHIRGQVAELCYMMLAAGRILAKQTGGEVVALLLGHNQQPLANDLGADRVWYTDHPNLADFTADAYLDVVAGQIQLASPRAVLFGHSSIGMDLASGLSARLDLPLVTQCQKVILADDALKFVCQLCGGKMMAEGLLPEPTALLTMVPGDLSPDLGRSAVAPEISYNEAPDLEEVRIKLLQYIEPDAEDIDITKEPVLIAVGRGLSNRDDLELVEELAETMGGTVCGSRPMVDLGWLPNSRMVGKSGRVVNPDLYLAMGISGAPEHVEAIIGSEMVIAVNTDPNAPIFDIAQFGAVVDMLDLLESLIDQIQGIPVV